VPSKTSAYAPRISTARFSLHRCAILPLILLLAVATHAVEPEEVMCAYTVQTPDGKFQLVPSETLRLLGANSADEPFVLPADAPPSVVSFNCIRSSPVPAQSDASVLDAGFGLYITAPTSGGRPLISMEKVDGRYVANVVSGRLSRAEKKQLEAALAAMNARTKRADQARAREKGSQRWTPAPVSLVPDGIIQVLRRLREPGIT
jgi:hypothetical protein